MHVPQCGMRQALIPLVGGVCNYEHHLHLQRVDGGLWAVADTTGLITINSLPVEEVVSLVSGMPFPLDGRPFIVRPDIDVTWLPPLQVRARQLAALQTAALSPLVAPVVGAEWYYADPAHDGFGTSCSLDSVLGRMHLEGSTGIGRTDPTLPWTAVERVLTWDVARWKAAKQRGARRDPRLSSPPLVLFKVAYCCGSLLPISVV